MTYRAAQGGSPDIDAWLYGLDDFGDEFFVLNRYQYFTLIRVWISEENYLPALTLLDKLDYYADLAQRPMYQIEIGIDRRIILSRMRENWQAIFLDVLHQASALRFVHIIACAGPEITDCLEALCPAASEDVQIVPDWLQTVSEQSRRFSRLDPHSLLSQPRPVLSENGLQILRLQAQGLSAQDIAVALHLKIDNVRYHIKENYRRLQVSSKTEAVLYAREQHLI